MAARVRKWLSASIKLELSLGELLLIVALVILINAIWPGVPTWVFVPIGLAIGVSRDIGRDLRRWLRRRRTA